MGGGTMVGFRVTMVATQKVVRHRRRMILPVLLVVLGVHASPRWVVIPQSPTIVLVAI